MKKIIINIKIKKARSMPAKALRNPLFKQQIIKSKKIYNRKKTKKNLTNNE